MKKNIKNKFKIKLKKILIFITNIKFIIIKIKFKIINI